MKMNCDNNMETVYILMVHFFCINSLKVPRTILNYINTYTIGLIQIFTASPEN